jgi:hypothetical protein
MRLYEYECPTCKRHRDAWRATEERHDGPPCLGGIDDQHAPATCTLVIAPVRGIVRNPAAGARR